MEINATKAVDFITRCIKANLAPMLTGPPGIGKSDIVRQIAEDYDMVLIDERMSTYDPVDLNGFPDLDKEKQRASYVPFNTFPLEGDTLPAGKNGWLVFLDELPSAPLSVQAAAYKLILDREVGKHKLHKNVAIVAAGNSMADNAIVNRMGTAMQSRLIHLKLQVDFKQWIQWGSKNGIDHRILAYVNNVPKNVHHFDPGHDDVTFACPRTWEFLSKLIKGIPVSGLRDLLPLITGTISTGVGTEFVAYTEVYSQIPTYDEIVKSPAMALVDNEPAMMFAISHLIAAQMSSKDVDKVMIYVERLPVEFQVITLQNTMARDKSMIKEKSIVKWTKEKGAELF